MQAPGTMNLRGVDNRTHGAGEFKVQLTMYAPDGHLISTGDHAWPGDGIVIELADLHRAAGEEVGVIRIEPYFEPDRDGRRGFEPEPRRP